MSYTVGQIAALLGLQYRGDSVCILENVSRWESADAKSLIFLEKDKPVRVFENVHAGCIIAQEALAPSGINVIFSEQPKLDFARAAAFLHPRPKSLATRHSTAIVAEDASIEEDVELGPWVVVEKGARIGKGSILKSGVIVGENCRIGKECILYPQVVLYPDVELGERVVLHAGVTVGSDGFGYVFDGSKQLRFPQIGSVRIGNDVEIGANTTIDRGSLGVTTIGNGAKVDNLVQIAHNVEIGNNVVIAAQTGISGSTVIEENAVIGGQVGFGDHARVQRGAVIGSKAGVLPGKIVRSGDIYWGVPVRPLREYKRLNAYFGRLPEMKEAIDSLKKEVAELKAALKKHS
jgi:UDP-3-O-[3-hydroxymyristoyl] glucosamine N-acyltransferase